MKQSKLPAILLCAFLFIGEWAICQNTYYFTKGLMVDGLHHYGREALYTDSLAFALNNKSLQRPVANAVFNTANAAIVWKEVSADSLHRFRSRGYGRGGYLYLTYYSANRQNVLLNIQGNSAVYVNGVLHAGDPYSSGFMYIPITLQKGVNEFYVRTYWQTVASLVFPAKPVSISILDSTLPYVVLNQQNGLLQGAVVVVNASEKPLINFTIESTVAGKVLRTLMPTVPAMATRKVIFNLDASAVNTTGKQACTLSLYNTKKIDEKTVLLDVVDTGKQYITTFVSNIDGSLQYYAVTQQTGGPKANAALFLSVHGAGVEAIGQAKAYKPKDWGTLVAATNRRPRGFNWEDWGRLDALEVLEKARARFQPDSQHIYLTGHSMGGHGTWFLGATYPDKWASIGPCSGYPTLKEYGSADGKIPDSSTNATEQLLLRAGNQSDVLNLATNYKPYGVYILHGDSDKVVSVDYARQMKKVLANYHPDFSYYEYPGGEHWFGDQSVDWKPLFDFFRWHVRLPDSAVNQVDFTTSSPGISSTYRWVKVLQQQHPLQYSRVKLQRNLSTGSITGSIENVSTMQLALKAFGAGNMVKIAFNNGAAISYNTRTPNDTVLLVYKNSQWNLGGMPLPTEKNPMRYGTFKEAFNNNMVFVYSTRGNPQENEWSINKAHYDAESWYYRGNGSVDIIADVDYSPVKYTNRGVIVYGNKSTNAAWPVLLGDCPIQIDRNQVTVANQFFTGSDLGAYYTWPLAGSATASVAVIGGTGLEGMRAAEANQYFAGGSGFADYMIFRSGMLLQGAEKIELAGFYNNQWQLDNLEATKQIGQ